LGSEATRDAGVVLERAGGRAGGRAGKRSMTVRSDPLSSSFTSLQAALDSFPGIICIQIDLRFLPSLFLLRDLPPSSLPPSLTWRAKSTSLPTAR
jgi:hypothetical protein